MSERSRGSESRVAACEARTSKSPSHVEELRSAVVRELRDWQDGMVLSPEILLSAVERYDGDRTAVRDRAILYGEEQT